CTPKKSKTVWSNYYDQTIYSGSYLAEKEKIVRAFIASTSFKTVIDVGANDGYFSKMISNSDCRVVAIDFDSGCVRNLYEFVRREQIRNILPLSVDIANPTPATGFNNLERSAFLDRSRFDLALCLALVHHLAISKNIPFENIAALFRKIADSVIIEFIPREDEKVVQLLEHRKDIFADYNLPSFEKAFEKYFTVVSKEKIVGTERVMYLLKSKEIS
ncbi:MAG: class I SAM-dependent methyltransferase, partial [Ginsengibacter sp.]